MAELLADCPRCGATHTTFDLFSTSIIRCEFEWQVWYEAFCVCRHCQKSTVFVLSAEGPGQKDLIEVEGGLSNVTGSINKLVGIESYISLKDAAGVNPPEHLPMDIHAAFVEGATCHAVGCHNAAATMFRLCVDLATRTMLPNNEENGLNRKVRRDLGLRLPWLFDHGRLPEGLRDLSSCIKEDGNDGAHVGNLDSADAEDMLDFTKVRLERIYTEPKRVELARVRREERRAKSKDVGA